MKYEVFACKHKAQVGQRPVRVGEAIMTCRKFKSLVIILIATFSCTIHKADLQLYSRIGGSKKGQ